MYHIKPDKRSQTSARLICEGLIECMKKKEFTQITITDIQRASGVGRSTFYRLFDNLSDVLQYICDRHIDNSIADVTETKNITLDEFMVKSINALMKNEAVITALVSSDRSDLLYKSIKTRITQIQNLISEKFNVDPTEQMSDSQISYFLGMIISAFAGILGVWIRNGRQESAAEVYANIKAFIAKLDGAKEKYLKYIER